MKSAIIGGTIGALIMLAAAVAFFSIANTESESATTPAPSSTDISALYQSRTASLPPHELYCIPETKSQCSTDGCEPVPPSVFVLIHENNLGVQLYRCDSKPCDMYPATAEVSGVNMEIRTLENHGMLFKTSTLDQSYVEVVTFGTDTLVSHGHCYKK